MLRELSKCVVYHFMVQDDSASFLSTLEAMQIKIWICKEWNEGFHKTPDNENILNLLSTRDLLEII